MSRFDLYRLPGGRQYVVGVQSEHASGKGRTRVMAPLTAVDELGAKIADINPVVTVDGQSFVLSPSRWQR